ncbi:CRISPR-associated endoribonuclease Cas6 [Williamwhitmania taraxaci]|uniref:CRISPR-associated endoribonuclease n=1 Tax=Williamwhitmania taraxaci TaxID=1640674 RepID=A0A1G6N366_9BACT|nr:CRISPR-associated endoribonuclease Cas6 [Williamwhitmania taraxaci]SDC62279.1 CRISPR-associated protein, Cas6 family [Williamwhitmania taraxaci]
MRFEIKLAVDGNAPPILPINYQYELASWIYRTIAEGDRDYATWLHTNGFSCGSKTFKLFCFSHLITPKRNIVGDRLHVLSPEISFRLSFLPERSTEEFIKGVFHNQTMILGDRISQGRFRVGSITLENKEDFTTWGVFKTLSPVVVSSFRDDRSKEYISPTDCRFGALLIGNLKQKYKLYHGHDYIDIVKPEFELLGEPKQKGITLKQSGEYPIKVIGYQFSFRLSADSALLQMGYAAGFGEDNSMGFGMCQLQ